MLLEEVGQHCLSFQARVETLDDSLLYQSEWILSPFTHANSTDEEYLNDQLGVIILKDIL